MPSATTGSPLKRAKVLRSAMVSVTVPRSSSRISPPPNSGIMVPASSFSVLAPASVRIAWPMTSTRWISGSLTFCGRLERTRVTASLTSLSARSVLVSSANWIVVTDRPSVIDDEICRTPSTPDTPSSIVLVTCDSSSAGAAPNCATATDITGMSALGSRVTASLVNLPQPTTRSMIEQAVDGGARDGDAARALGVDIGAGKHADLERRIVVQRNPHLAKLRGAVDLRRDLPDLADNIGRVVTADAHRRTRIELEQMHARHFGFELDFIVHGNPEHRACLRRGGRADRGPDLGDEAAGGSAQRDRPGPAGGGARDLRRRREAREFRTVGD